MYAQEAIISSLLWPFSRTNLFHVRNFLHEKNLQPNILDFVLVMLAPELRSILKFKLAVVFSVKVQV